MYDAFQKATPEERKPVLKLLEKYAIMDEADIKLALCDIIDNRSYHPQNALLRNWVANATTHPKDEHPRYVEGKGIYVPIIGKYLAMRDCFGGEEVTWDEAVKEGAPTRDEWYIILYYKDKINRLLRENGGELLVGEYWTSTEHPEGLGWYVTAGGYTNYGDKGGELYVRAWVNVNN